MEEICILMPVYNSENFLEDTLNSILLQTFSSYKVIMIDDGSEDNSGAICNKYAESDSRFYVVHTENRGAGNARNRAIDEAMKFSGKYIAWVDSDDKLHPQYLEQLYEAAMLHPNCDMVQCDYSTDEKTVDGVKREGVLITDRDELLCMMEERTDFQLLWNKLYKKSLYSTIRVRVDDTITGKINDDINMLWRIYTKSQGCYWFHSRLYFYRQVEGSLEHRKKSVLMLESFELFWWRYSCLEKEAEYSHYIKMLKEKYLFSFAYQLRLPKNSYVSYPEFYKAIKNKYYAVNYNINFECGRIDLRLLEFFGKYFFAAFRVYGRLYYVFKSMCHFIK